ncbi:AbrB/MazE/SpoVT family DNA-binding domain-containing protein [Desertibaculum subflavum]|uniref:AbrB/MazE/SpoVT family DNA-binding domain-containing protein n=1 Tax=Desertibaculum subflavum TaxID=2268458 RepID=UPI000E668B8D
MFTLKLTTIGNSVGVVLPKEVLHQMKVAKGDVLFLTETPNGYAITPYNEAFARQMEAAQRIMKRRRTALRALAK